MFTLACGDLGGKLSEAFPKPFPEHVQERGNVWILERPQRVLAPN